MGINRPDTGDSFFAREKHIHCYHHIKKSCWEEQATNAHISLNHITWGEVVAYMLSEGRGPQVIHGGGWRQDIFIGFAGDDHEADLERVISVATPFGAWAMCGSECLHADIEAGAEGDG